MEKVDGSRETATPQSDPPYIRVYASRVHNLKTVDVAMPRDQFVVFTGVSGSGKSSLAFGTIYAEAQRRYFESVAPYARRLLLPQDAPKVDDITGGLPPAVALQQRRGTATSRSTVGTVTTLSNLLRMLLSRAGTTRPALRSVSTRMRSRRTPRSVPARSVMVSAASTRSPSRRWCPTRR